MGLDLFRIADTFTESLARLTGEEQKAVKTTAFDLQLNLASPGMQFHKLDRAKDKNFWSVRVNADLRLIVHRTVGSLLLCYVDHHDRAYDWAGRRKLETHPKTGAAQFVEIRQTVKEIVMPVYVQSDQSTPAKPPKSALFADRSDDELLGYGVPPEWLGEVRTTDEDGLLVLADRLPGEAAEALLEIATGGKPRTSRPAVRVANPFDHPDAQRRFRVVQGIDELQRALDFPWEKWTVFLHPEQRELVERDQNGPARVSGSAGTGKTIVALHRAVHLARTHPDARVLLTTFSETLANALRTNLRRLLGSEPRLGERLEVHCLSRLGVRLHQTLCGPVNLVSDAELGAILKSASETVGAHKFSLRFLVTEWNQVVDAWQLQSWDGYRDVVRLGRKTRLPEPQRRMLWSIFERVRETLSGRGLVTMATVFSALAERLKSSGKAPFDFAIVDEAQDLNVSQLRFLAALGNGGPNALFFAGDLGQRIFQPPFSWKALGVDVRGRSRTLRVNYRTSHQIRQQADRLMGPEVSDVDGNREARSDTISVFNGPPPEIRVFASKEDEANAVLDWLRKLAVARIPLHEIAIFVRSTAELDRVVPLLGKTDLAHRVLDDRLDIGGGCISISTMHLAKGLEFRAVAVVGCDDEIIPLQERIQSVGDDADLQEVYDTERQLLYVACTRARDRLLVTAVAPASEFLDDLG